MSLAECVAIVTDAGGGLGRAHALFLARQGARIVVDDFRLVGEDAPARAILCAGAGHFAVANVTLSRGRYAGAGDDAGEQLVRHWNEVSDRAGEIVPAYGFTQAERELASAGAETPVAAVPR